MLVNLDPLLREMREMTALLRRVVALLEAEAAPPSEEPLSEEPPEGVYAALRDRLKQS